jgi:hypothetical protein
LEAFILTSYTNTAIQPYQRESILIKDTRKQSRCKSVSIYPVERNTPDEGLQSSLAIIRNDVRFDLSKQIIEQSNLRNSDPENVRDIFIEKYEQTKVAYNRSTFSVTI